MSTGYKINDGQALYFLTFQIVGWVDIFTRRIYKDTLIDSFRYCQTNKGLNLFAYVIMSNHFHLFAQSETGDLIGFIRDFKNYTSKKFLELLNDGIESRRDWMKLVFEYHGKFKHKQSNQIWTHERHAEEIYSQKFIEQKIEYIHNNPVRAGIVTQPGNYLYSSARNYADLDNVSDVILIPGRFAKVKLLMPQASIQENELYREEQQRKIRKPVPIRYIKHDLTWKTV